MNRRDTDHVKGTWEARADVRTSKADMRLGAGGRRKEHRNWSRCNRWSHGNRQHIMQTGKTAYQQLFALVAVAGIKAHA